LALVGARRAALVLAILTLTATLVALIYFIVSGELFRLMDVPFSR